jgi:uncharacterized protein YceK
MKRLAVLLFVVLMSGCATISDTLERIDGSSVTMQILASQSSARFIQNTDRDRWQHRAQEVVQAIGVMRLYVEANERVTLQSIAERASEIIPWEKLTPADEALIRELYVIYAARLSEGVEDGMLTPEARVSVLALLGAFERGAQPFLR